MGINDRFSKVKLTEDDLIEIPEISTPGSATANTGRLYCKDSSGTTKLYFKDSAGTETDIIATTSNTLDQAYDQGGAGAGRTISATDGAVLIQNTQADAAFCLEVDASPVAGAATGGIKITSGANSSEDSLQIANSGTGDDIQAGGGAFTVSAAAAVAAASVVTTGDVTVGGNLAVTGTWQVDDIDAATVGATLYLDGNAGGGVNICSTSTGGVTLGDDVTVADGKDMLVGEGKVTIDDDQNEAALVITADNTTANAIEITSLATTGDVIHVTADDLGVGGAMLLLDTDNIAANNFYIECYDGTADDFTVSLYGATTIAGNAATDVLTITAGNFQMTNGDIDVDEGKLEIDTTTNESSYIKRNQGVTTTPVLELEETAAAADSPVLLIDQNATAAASYGIEIDTAGGTGIYVNCENAAGDGIVFATPASYTGQLLKVEDTIIGTNGEGVVSLKTTANMVAGAALQKIHADTGTLVGATSGFLLKVVDETGAQATSYAVDIASTNNEALHVGAGKAVFDEQATFTLGIDSNHGLDIDLADNTGFVDVAAAATDYAAGSGVVTVYGSGAGGQTNASYLMRLARKADGDAQDHFILCEDNSTGAAGNGDDMFQVNATGQVIAAGGVAPGPTATNVHYSKTVTLTSAEVKALKASPKELVAAPGAGYMIVFDSATLILDYGSNVFTETDDNLVIQYNTGGTDVTASIETTGFIDQAADQVAFIRAATVATATAASCANRALEIYNPNDEIAGNAANDSTLDVIVNYWIVATGL